MCFIRGVKPPGLQHAAQVINMPRLMSSPSIASAPSDSQPVCVIHTTAAAARVRRPSRRDMLLLRPVVSPGRVAPKYKQARVNT